MIPMMMIRSLHIDGYRCFDRFEMSDLGRVNLLVGKNNSGKTSVLEAIYLLSSGGHPAALWQLMSRRGESVQDAQAGRRAEAEFEICHLFTGHELVRGPGSALRHEIKALSDESRTP
jgi:hypothetical protein